MWDGRPRPSDRRKRLGNWPNSRKGTRVLLRDAKMAKPEMAIYYGEFEEGSRKATMLPWTGKVN
jgi:hypothetical protein